MKKALKQFPKGWNGKKVRAVIEHYDRQSEEQEAAEDDAAFGDPDQTMVLVPRSPLPKVNELLSVYREFKNGSGAARKGRRTGRGRASRRAHAA